MTAYDTRETLKHCARTVLGYTHIPSEDSDGVLRLSSHQMIQYTVAADIHSLYEKHGSKNLGHTSEEVIKGVISLEEESIVDLVRDLKAEQDPTLREILQYRIDQVERVVDALSVYLLDTLGVFGLYGGPTVKRQTLWGRIKDLFPTL